MISRKLAGPLGVAAALGLLQLAGCGTLGAGATAPGTQRPATGPARHSAASPAGPAATGPVQRPAGRFSRPRAVGNRMFPLVPGTEFAYRGTVAEDGKVTPHTVVFTVTDLSKVVDHVRTVVAWDRDFLKGSLHEQELAFFAQDDAGNVWNFGEYPEEYAGRRFTGAPSTWIRGTGGAYGGIHMLAWPSAGKRYSEGLVPAIQFDDVSTVTGTGKVSCSDGRCYHGVLVVDETSPNDPASGHQIKYYAPGTGLIRVGARGGDSREFLRLTSVRRLGPAEVAKVRAAARAMERRAYRVSRVYRVTAPAQPAG
jgi:hypothetical protein